MWNTTPIKAKMLAGVYWVGADEIKNKKGVYHLSAHSVKWRLTTCNIWY